MITGTNDAPVITSAAQAGAVSEGDDGASKSASGQVTFSDVDTSDTRLLAQSSEVESRFASVGRVRLWHYTVSDAGAVDALAAGETLSDTFAVKVADSQGGFGSQDTNETYTLSLHAALPISAAQAGAVSEGDDGSSKSASGQVTFSDVDTSDT